MKTATYDDSFEVMLNTAKEYDRYSKHSQKLANNAMHRLFGQAELCRELFGVSVLQTLHRIERKLDE